MLRPVPKTLHQHHTMTAITRNLPWFIVDLGTTIIGEASIFYNLPFIASEHVFQKCYSSLVENLNFGDVDCLKYSLSKGLGLGIVVGGSIMKVPQLMLSKPSIACHPRQKLMLPKSCPRSPPAGSPYLRTSWKPSRTPSQQRTPTGTTSPSLPTERTFSLPSRIPSLHF